MVIIRLFLIEVGVSYIKGPCSKVTLQIYFNFSEFTSTVFYIHVILEKSNPSLGSSFSPRYPLIPSTGAKFQLQRYFSHYLMLFTPDIVVPLGL